MSYDISINYGNVSISGIEIDVDLSDILEPIDSEVLTQELKDRGEFYLDSITDDELTDEVVNRDAERDMLDKIDNALIIDQVGADDLLSEIDDDDILAYVRENDLIVDEASLDEAGTDELVTELMKRGELDAILSQIDSEFIQDHMEKQRGGFTLENVPVDDLVGALEAVNALPGIKVPAEVGQAFKIASDFINASYFDIHNGQLAGKRFIIE